MALLGLSLQPNKQFLQLTRRIAEEWADFFEIVPETLWRSGDEFTPAHRMFEEMRRRSGKPFVGHGVALSLGSPSADARLDLWVERIRRDHDAFHFEWYSDHLGFVDHDGVNAALPLPLPLTQEAARAVAGRLRRLKAVVADVAFENNVTYFTLGDPRGEPEFFNEICRQADCLMLLDLHNVYTQCANLDLRPMEYLRGIDLTRVVEIHLSGGGPSDPEWLPSGRVFRLDSHDGPVPDLVWSMFEWALPRCPHLRGVVVERIETGLAPEQIDEYERDFRRAKEMMC